MTTCPGHMRILNELKNNGYEPKVIYDIGSCIAHWADITQSLYPNAEIHCFEPNPFPYVTSIYDYRPYKFHNVMLSCSDDVSTRYYYSHIHIGGNSMYQEVGKHHNESVPMKTISLDTYALNLPSPNLVKIDVQGSELDILRGGKNTLKNADYIICETSHDYIEYNIGGSGFSEVDKYLNELGFMLQKEINRTPVDADYIYFNYKKEQERVTFKDLSPLLAVE